ncbi:MAG: hypothetical protein IT393_05140 [Nitrospirae bacterium]|nr:hypothetical protein [Nitrospirota bacterium]
MTLKNMKKYLYPVIAATCLALVFMTGKGQAAQQYQGLCSYVKIEILQELTMERVGFLATLEVTNNEGDASITDFSAALTFGMDAGDGTITDASNLFFVQPPKIKSITAIDGTGIISPGQKAVVEWFIIPKLSAGGTTPDGRQYAIGAQLAGSIYGMEISQDVLRVLPDTITVKPDPELEITYFQPRDVDGDNPFTPQIVESPIPFTLGVMVKNVGFGQARSVKIASEQPRIVENLQGLLVVPQLIGSRVDDRQTDSTSLTVNLGDIQPGKCRKGAWDMITTLSGEFTEFRASYTHAPELGGRDTSLIRDINAWFMVHEVMNDQPGRDNLRDFLAETLGGEQLIPDTLYESDCNTLPVNRLDNVGVLAYSGYSATVRATADRENWVFMRVDDPAQARFRIGSVVRSDGKVLNPNNYWTNIRYRQGDNAKLTYLNIFDFVALGEYQYTVTYEPIGTDTEPPVTTLLLSGQNKKINDTYFVLPETQIFFIAEDYSPVGTYYKLDSAPDFVPAYPFNIQGAGTHILEYYSADLAGNEETHQIATIAVSTADPGIENITTDSETLFIAGDSISVRPTSVTVGFNGVVTADSLSADMDVFRGVFGYPTLSGVPSSPIRSGNAAITVGGENVDFYRYRLGSGAWSGEFPVSQAINLTGFSGPVLLSVSGRSQYGSYHPDNEAVVAAWTVDAAAEPVVITGVPAMPSRLADAALLVSGSAYYCYRLDGTYYRPDTGAGAPIILTRLSDGEHTVEVRARASAGTSCPATGAGTIVRWSVNRQYGLSFPLVARVRHHILGQVDANTTGFTWDGRNDSGVVVPPGWYSVRITVNDGLGRAAGAVRLVYVGDMVSDGSLLSDAGNAGQKEAYAFGKWVVWQDQRNGNWDIFALDLSNSAASPVVLTNNALNQERPRTDGRFVVWEDRQSDGTWDIWAKEPGSVNPAFAITETSEFDERKPVIYWPWVVYQTKPVSNPGAPWQLMAYNMITAVTEAVDATTQDQLDPAIHHQLVVWQDFRDVGYGEIYLKDLRTGDVRRITNNPGGQYHPAIFNQWIVWADNRNGQFDLYGYNLRRNAEIRLTNTPEDETRPYINDKWVVYTEDSAGELDINLRLLHLSNLASVQLTNAESEKEKPSLASGRLIWSELHSGRSQVMAGTLPDLQPVFDNQNTVAVTEGMVSNQGDAYTLLKLWNEQAGVSEITRYTTLLPQPVADTVQWTGGAPAGNNFALESGTFLWVRFNDTNILDLGQGTCTDINLAAGANVFSYSCFPDHYSAYNLIRELGTANVRAIRLLDSETGRWEAASVSGGLIVGEDFDIPSVAVVMIDMKVPFGPWRPGE